MNRIHSKNRGIETYDISGISLSCFVDKFTFLITEFMR